MGDALKNFRVSKDFCLQAKIFADTQGRIRLDSVSHSSFLPLANLGTPASATQSRARVPAHVSVERVRLRIGEHL